jgi:hypothetical protein
MTKSICSVNDCTNPSRSRGFCTKHYERFRTHGDPHTTHRYYKSDPLARFMSKVAVVPDACHEWQGGRFGSGYGNFTIDGKGRIASRRLFEHLNGPIPEGIQVRHKCDNPPCVNIDHLELGTQLDNSRDMVERGRSLVGERTHTAKLSADDVKEIRALVARGDQTKTAIARSYGTTRQNVTHIVNSFSWKHVA